MNTTINNIDYDLSKMNDLQYVLEKAYQYVEKVGWDRATTTQKFIRHIHIFIALKLKAMGIPAADIRFETKLENKDVDLCVFKEDKPFLVISIKSQSRSIKKNFTNAANALQGEATHLKNSYPELKVATFILYKKTDTTINEDCTTYYTEKIPAKILPIITPYFKSSNKFDNGCIVVWDNNGNIITVDNTILVLKEFDTSNFFNWVKEIYEGKVITSQFGTDEINTKITDFLNDETII